MEILRLLPGVEEDFGNYQVTREALICISAAALNRTTNREVAETLPPTSIQKNKTKKKQGAEADNKD